MIINRAQLVDRYDQPIKNMLGAKHRAHGVSHGLTEAGYDIRLKQGLLFSFDDGHPVIDVLDEESRPFRTFPGRFTIASAIEEFDMPEDLVGVVHGKSTWARQGISVFNTVIEPGWKGFLTLEIVFHGSTPVNVPAGCGIAQVLFHRTAVPAAYTGKYQNQEDQPVAARFEKAG